MAAPQGRYLIKDGQQRIGSARDILDREIAGDESMHQAKAADRSQHEHRHARVHAELGEPRLTQVVRRARREPLGQRHDQGELRTVMPQLDKIQRKVIGQHLKSPWGI